MFQKKLILLILLALVILNVVVFGGGRFILLDSYLQLERQAVEENLLRVANAVRNDSEDLGVLCADWAFWDDTYQFIRDKNPDYISSNLPDETMSALSLNAILFFNAQGELVFAKGMGQDGEPTSDIPVALLDYFQQGKKFWPPQLQFSRQDGLLLFPAGPMLLSFRPILSSLEQGPALGILVMARWFNQDVINEIGARIALPLSLVPLSTEPDGPDNLVCIHPAAENAEVIHGDVLLHDLASRPVFRLSIDMPRSLFKQGQRTVTFFQLSFLLISCLAGLILYLLLIVAYKKRSAAEKRFQYVFEHATDGLLVVEEPGRLASINSAARNMLGGAVDLSQAEQVCFGNSDLRELIATGLMGKVAGPLELSLADQEQGQQTHLRVYMAPMLCEDGKRHGTIATLQDITREKELEQQKNEFIASAAHELNTPLTIILGYTDLLVSREYDDEELMEFLQLVNEKTHSLERIVDDLLHLGKIESGREFELKVELYDLSARIRQIVEGFKKESPEHNFVVNLLDEDVLIAADRYRMGQVFDNLISNAVKYSPDGGTITVSSSYFENELLICVADQGIGLTEEQIGRVFEKFYRADNSATAVRGLGLGLNITRSIIQAHGGRIWLESKQGEGTRFYFTLPAVEPAAGSVQ